MCELVASWGGGRVIVKMCVVLDLVSMKQLHCPTPGFILFQVHLFYIYPQQSFDEGPIIMVFYGAGEGKEEYGKDSYGGPGDF